jgi:hypothetical protein
MARWFTLLLLLVLSNEVFAALRFTNAVTVALGDSATDPLLMVDVNGDGRPDLLAGRQVFVQQTNGTLSWTMSFPDEWFHPNYAVGDFNRDGKLDVYRSTNVWLGAGDGTFTLHTSLPVWSYSSSYFDARAADCNNDGNLDLVTCGEQRLHVWLGDGSGMFAPAPVSNRLDRSWCKLDMGDFNRDGVADVALYQGENYDSNTVTVLTGKGDGTFTNVTGYARPGYDRAFIRVADLNLDDVPDVMVAGFYFPTGSVFLGQAAGGLGPRVNSGRASGNAAFQLADLNGDGYLDQVVAGSGGLLVSLGRGDGTFTNQPPISLSVTGFLYGLLAVGDYNRDLKPDVAVLHENNAVTVLTNYSEGVAVRPLLALRSHAPDVLNWPVLSNGFFALEFRSSLNTNVTWRAVTNGAVRRGTNMFVTNAPGTSRGFYRLRQF